MKCATALDALAAYAASDFNQEALAIARAAFALHARIGAFLEKHGDDAAAEEEFGAGVARDMTNAVADMRGFRWGLELFVGFISGACAEEEAP